MEDGLQLGDLDEAYLVISMKNDEINNLKSSIKTTEKKHSLKLTDLQFRVDQEKGRSAELERKFAKAEDAHNKARELLEEQLKKGQEERHRLSQVINELHAEARKKEREFKAALFESQLQLQREREVSGKLAADVELLHRHFDPKKILSALQKRGLEEIPSYIELYKRSLEQTEEAKQLSLEMERLRSETYLGMEEAFKKLTSYEAVMESLSQKNRELEEDIRGKEEELELHSQEIDEKKQLLEAVKEQASEQVDELTDQIETLRTYVSHQHSSQAQPGDNRDQQLEYHRTIQQLERTIEQNEGQLAQMQAEFEQRLLQLQQENTCLKNDMFGIGISALAQKEDFESAIASLRRELAEKEELVMLLNNSIKEQEDFFESKQAEFNRHIAELTQLLRRKKRAEEEWKESEAVYKAQVQALNDEVTFLRHQLYSHEQRSNSESHDRLQQQQVEEEGAERLLRRARSGVESLRSFGEHHNLFADLREKEGSVEGGLSRADIGHYEQEPNWSELYYALLQRHNEFARRVQGRLQAMASRRRQ